MGWSVEQVLDHHLQQYPNWNSFTSVEKHDFIFTTIQYNKTQYRTEQNRTEQNRAEQNRTEQYIKVH